MTRKDKTKKLPFTKWLATRIECAGDNGGDAAGGRKVIVIDPGHGGKDPGASAHGVTEKNVNLAIGLELERILTLQGFRVIMTRRTDVYLQLQERTDIANNVNADLFVSVHVNALPSRTSMTGFEIGRASCRERV